MFSNFQLKVRSQASEEPDALLQVGSRPRRRVGAKFEELVKVLVHRASALVAAVVLGDFSQNS